MSKIKILTCVHLFFSGNYLLTLEKWNNKTITVIQELLYILAKNSTANQEATQTLSITGHIAFFSSFPFDHLIYPPSPKANQDEIKWKCNSHNAFILSLN